MGTFVQKSNKVHVAMILDESGSMYNCWGDTIGGANSYFDTLKEKEEVDYEVTIMKFDTEYRPLVENRPLAEVPEITSQNYTPRGGTALYDAVGRVLSKMESKVEQNEKAIVVVITDGEENSSVEHSETSIKPWIERLQGKGNWTFVYLGAVDNAWSHSRRMGFSMGNTAKFSKDSTRSVFSSLAKGTVDYSVSNYSSTNSFYQTYVDDHTGIEAEEDDQ